MEKKLIEENRALMLENFNAVHDDVLAAVEDYVTHGYLQSLANLLVFLGEGRAKNVLEKLPEALQKEVREQYENPGSKNNADSQVISDVQSVLQKSDLEEKSLCEKITAGLDFKTLHLLSLETEKLAKTDPIIAATIEKYLFEFEDLLKLDDCALQKVLRETEQQTVALALKKADIELQEKIFNNMSVPACKMLKEDMKFMGSVRLKDIENPMTVILMKSAKKLRLSQKE